MIRIAAVYCGADVVKFQKRDNRVLLPARQYNSPHPNPANAYATYGQHREYLEFDLSSTGNWRVQVVQNGESVIQLVSGMFHPLSLLGNLSHL